MVTNLDESIKLFIKDAGGEFQDFYGKCSIAVIPNLGIEIPNPEIPSDSDRKLFQEPLKKRIKYPSSGLTRDKMGK
jgi:hypothetical protein